MKFFKKLLLLIMTIPLLNTYAEETAPQGTSEHEDPIFKENYGAPGRHRSRSNDFILCHHEGNFLSFILHDEVNEAYIEVKQGFQIIAYGYITNEQNTIAISSVSGEIFVRVVTSQNVVYSGYIVL